MEKLLLVGERILVDSDVRALVAREEYEVLTAENWQDGAAIFREQQPAIVLLELDDDGGIDVLKALREEDETCEVILVTSGGEMELAIEALRAGALDYLRHPVDKDQLQVALGRARERRQKDNLLQAPAILVLEDHEPTRRRLVKVLEKEGYRVDAAEDGEEGMGLFRDKRFDLILADVRMPRKDGLTVLSETKGRGADVEVIVVTGYGDEDIVVRALRDGAINFLRKPVDIEEMLLAIEKALDHQVTRRSLAYRNRDLQLVQELVVRLTKKLEVVVAAPEAVSAEATCFLHELVDTLPIGIVVCGSDRQLIFANQHVTDKIGEVPQRLGACYSALGIEGSRAMEFDSLFRRTIAAKPGTVETLMLSKWTFVVMTPIKLVRPASTQRFVAMAISGERSDNSS